MYDKYRNLCVPDDFFGYAPEQEAFDPADPARAQDPTCSGDLGSLPDPKAESDPEPDQPPKFDFRKEMNITRLHADQLLAEGKIEQAEEYMEERRLVFWENGYHSLRRLNQAYFAFHGAYADEPGGAAGTVEDPIGSAVRALRMKSTSLLQFLNRASWITSYADLQQAVGEDPQ